MTDFLVDNSVWARLATGDPAITARLRRIERAPADLFVTCPPQVLEFCHSAGTPTEHARYREQISLGFPLERAPDESLVLDIQSALWSSGLVRAAGSVDILIAGYAIANGATVLAADRDFDHLAKVIDLQHEYVAPTAPNAMSETRRLT
ncbi:MAG: PIN domain-containing protein [Propionibacteriaceae bacterium]|nr:PIN domain-containing protein [Propionibacteriaceae bacterium]